MTTKTEVYLKDFNDNQPDRLLDTRIINLTNEQEDYLSLYMDMDRPQLFRTFKKRFNNNINKLQFNFALEKVRNETVKEVKVSPSKLIKYPRPDVPKEKNVHWVTEQGIWDVKFKRQGKTKSLGRFRDHDRAVKVAQEFRKNSA